MAEEANNAAEEAKKELSKARAEYKAALGKNPSPRLDAAGVRAKLAEIQAAAPAAAPAEEAEARQEAASEAAAKAPAASDSAPHRHRIMSAIRKESAARFAASRSSRTRDGKILVPVEAMSRICESHGFEIGLAHGGRRSHRSGDSAARRQHQLARLLPETS
jgi:hypothetical protein